MVGETGFEPATSSSRTKRATRLRYTPIKRARIIHGFRFIASDRRSRKKKRRKNGVLAGIYRRKVS